MPADGLRFLGTDDADRRYGGNGGLKGPVASLSQRARDALGGYAPDWRRNLDSAISPGNLSRIASEFGRGKGGELAGERSRPAKMAAQHSSAALCINSFARWRNRPADLGLLELAGISGFDGLEFEVVRPTGLQGTPPHLDLIASGPDGTVAVESKCTEYLTPHPAEFRPAYDRAVAELADPSWRRLYEQLRDEPELFRCVDAAQLVKHYLGLKNSGELPLTLLYLYWEPGNADELDEIRAHRAEVDQLCEALADRSLSLEATSYRELWRSWADRDEPDWLQDHVAWLEARYLIAI